MNKIHIISFLFLIGTFSACAQKQVINDPNAEVRKVDQPFNSIKVSNSIAVYLSQGNEEAIAVSASKEEYKNAIKTEVKNGELNIYYQPEGNSWSFKSKNLRVYVSCKNLSKIQSSGSSNVYVAGSLSAASLYINLSGSSNFKGNIKVDNLAINLSGASDAKIDGVASNVNIEARGASDVVGKKLISDVCNVNISGASDVYITVNKELSVHASGASDVSYKGNAVIKKMEASGSSSVKKGK